MDWRWINVLLWHNWQQKVESVLSDTAASGFQFTRLSGECKLRKVVFFSAA
jgi:hypothetical protein